MSLVPNPATGKLDLVKGISAYDSRYLKLDGSNANTSINIGSQSFTTTGALNSGIATITTAAYTTIIGGATYGIDISGSGTYPFRYVGANVTAYLGYGGVVGGYFTYGGRIAQIVTLQYAATFTDGTRTVNLCDGTYAISATGDSYINGILLVTQNVNADVLSDGYLSIEDGSISDAINATFSGYIQAGKIGLGVVPSYPIHAVSGATDTYLLYLDGTTNDYTGTDAYVYTADLARDYNFGTNAIPTVLHTRNAMFDKSTDSIVPLNKEHKILNNYYYKSGALTNTESSYKQILVSALYNEMYVYGSFDTDSTGGIGSDAKAGYNYLNFAPTLKDTGGNNPNSYVYNYGEKIYVYSHPTISSGTWYIRSYGLYIEVIGTTAGSQTTYGIYINNCSGGDANYALYDVTSADWILDADNKKIKMGDTSTDLWLYSDGDNACLDSSGAIKLGGNVYPKTDNTYYLGKNDDDTPLAYKGVILKDTTNGNYYRIEIINGVITATDLTD